MVMSSMTPVSHLIAECDAAGLRESTKWMIHTSIKNTFMTLPHDSQHRCNYHPIYYSYLLSHMVSKRVSKMACNVAMISNCVFLLSSKNISDTLGGSMVSKGCLAVPILQFFNFVPNAFYPLPFEHLVTILGVSEGIC